MNASDESGDVDASEQLTGSWLRRAMTGPQPSTLPAAAAPTPKAVPRTTTGARPRASGPAARRKTPRTCALCSARPPASHSPIDRLRSALARLLRRAAGRARAHRSPGWRWTFRAPRLRRAARATSVTTAPRRTIPVDRYCARGTRTHARRRRGGDGGGGGGGGGGGRARALHAARRCAARGARRTRHHRDALPVMAPPGPLRAGRASRAARVSRRKKRTVPIVRGDAEVPRALAFDCARSPLAGARPRGDVRARRRILEDPNALDALSLRALAQVDRCAGERCPSGCFSGSVAAASASRPLRATPLGPISATRGAGRGVRAPARRFPRRPPRHFRGVRVVPAGVRDRDVPPERVSDVDDWGDRRAGRWATCRRPRVSGRRDFVRFQPDADWTRPAEASEDPVHGRVSRASSTTGCAHSETRRKRTGFSCWYVDVAFAEIASVPAAGRGARGGAASAHARRAA